MAMSSRLSEPAPMFEMNTTPLIDVMLVLLIMFIITIPLQSHAVKIDLPAGLPVLNPDPVRNRIVVTAKGQILWNGVPTGKQALAQVLAATQRMNPVPELHLQPEPNARYELVDEVLVMTKRAGVRNMGFVGNEAYGRF
jgi:biopolymer transport protein ExbD